MIDLFFLPFICAGIWLLICNQCTYKQVMSIHEVVFQQEDWNSALRDFNTVAYEQHLWALFSFRDAKKLYPPTIQTLMGWGPL